MTVPLSNLHLLHKHRSCDMGIHATKKKDLGFAFDSFYDARNF